MHDVSSSIVGGNRFTITKLFDNLFCLNNAFYDMMPIQLVLEIFNAEIK